MLDWSLYTHLTIQSSSDSLLKTQKDYQRMNCVTHPHGSMERWMDKIMFITCLILWWDLLTSGQNLRISGTQRALRIFNRQVPLWRCCIKIMAALVTCYLLNFIPIIHIFIHILPLTACVEGSKFVICIMNIIPNHYIVC